MSEPEPMFEPEERGERHQMDGGIRITFNPLREAEQVEDR